MRRYVLRDDQWDRIRDLLPGRLGSVGVTASDPDPQAIPQGGPLQWGRITRPPRQTDGFFRKLSARPRRHAQNLAALTTFKKTSPAP